MVIKRRFGKSKRATMLLEKLDHKKRGEDLSLENQKAI